MNHYKKELNHYKKELKEINEEIKLWESRKNNIPMWEISLFILLLSLYVFLKGNKFWILSVIIIVLYILLAIYIYFKSHMSKKRKRNIEDKIKELEEEIELRKGKCVIVKFPDQQSNQFRFPDE